MIWKTFKSIGITKQVTSQPKVILNSAESGIEFDTKKVCDMFKLYYEKLAPSLVNLLAEPINVFGNEYLRKFYNNSISHFSFKTTDSLTIKNIILDLDISKSSGIDNISTRFIQDGLEVLLEPLTNLVNLSLLTKFPDRAKIAKVKTIHKKGDKTDPANYRPISLLPIMSKILEKAAKLQIENYLETNKMLYKYQSGFRKFHSTNTSLSHLSNQIITNFEKGMMTGMILIDLQKAFDTLDHKVLCEKLPFLGFDSSSIFWIHSYLKDRQFYVNIDNYLSNPGTLTYGVPQGSILGPLLFLIYINDLPGVLNKCQVRFYADDTVLMFSDKCLNTINNTLNQEFSDLCNWFIYNKLSIHLDEKKTKCILFSRTKNTDNVLNIKSGDSFITQYNTVEYLGCLLDSRMSGESMAKKCLIKINNRLNFLKRYKYCLSQKLRRMLCNSIIQPHFEYGCSAWYPPLNNDLKQKIQSAQNKCIRFCLNIGPLSHIGYKEFRAINWLPCSYRIEQCLLVLAHNYFSQKCPEYMDEIFIKKFPLRETRNSDFSLLIPFLKKKISRCSVSYRGAYLWNKLPPDIRALKEINNFKHKIKEFFFLDTKLL